jgi:hypothetical protein
MFDPGILGQPPRPQQLILLPFVAGLAASFRFASKELGSSDG